MSKTPLFVLSLLLSVFFVGCATPETRIRKNPELFAQLTPEQQEMIRKGKVDLGFTAEMVRLALGEPDRLTSRKEAGGTSEVWHYITYTMPTGSPLYRGWYHRYYMWRDPIYPWYMDYDMRRENDRFSVIFKEGKVSALESETNR